MYLLKRVIAWLLTGLYRVELRGLEHARCLDGPALIVANHTSFLDALLLAVFLPGPLTFAVNTQVAGRWWLRPLRPLVRLFPLDPANPLALKGLIREVEAGARAVIFPEGRITVTGGLMKIYDGPALVADKTRAAVLPVHIDGPQYSPFARLDSGVPRRWFPRVRISVLPPRVIALPEALHGDERRRRAGAALAELMTDTRFAAADTDRTLFQAVLDARRLHGGRHPVVEDLERRPLGYDALITRSLVLARALRRLTAPGERVGVLLPSATTTAALFLGLGAAARVPAMLNFTTGAKGMASACRTAQVRTVLSSRRFVEQAGLAAEVEQLARQVRLVFLEDLRIGALDKAIGWLLTLFAGLWVPAAKADDPAVVLFTSGSEGEPKGVVLSHRNLLANRAQLAAVVDFSARDVVFNALPLFHSFGLTAGTVLPLTAGMKVFLYPSPLHYRVVPELAYDSNATVLFGTNTFLAGYARHAHPYDFYRVRYVFAGAERLQAETRRQWMEKFGLRVLEGYGATETAPVLAANTPMHYREGSVGRLLPGIGHRLEPVAGVAEGGRLWVRGPNVMRGYLLPERPGELVPPADGWYDTGDIVAIDADGFVTIRGRAKRFAKVGGEMVSLGAVEELAGRVWPQAQHAVVALADGRKGEELVLVTSQSAAQRAELLARARTEGIGELLVPRRLRVVERLPLLATGKVDYRAVSALVRMEEAA